MTDTENTPKTTAPEQESPSGLSDHHPFAQAVAALCICLNPTAAEAEVEILADELGRALITDRIESLDEAEAILAGQSRVMNAAFTRLLAHAFLSERGPNLAFAKTAFVAQRQCADTINKLKKLKKNDKQTKEQ